MAFAITQGSFDKSGFYIVNSTIIAMIAGVGLKSSQPMFVRSGKN
ncbi:MAG: hypothetical protein ABIB04_04550 [Patescibacteria group bacterium]